MGGRCAAGFGRKAYKALAEPRLDRGLVSIDIDGHVQSREHLILECDHALEQYDVRTADARRFTGDDVVRRV